MLAAGISAADAAQERGRTTPQTDRTVTVTKGARLSVTNDAGEVVLRTWDRDSIRVLATHNSRVTIDIQATSNIVTVRGRASSGPTGGIDYEITAPAWLPVKVSGQFIYIGIEGVQNEVSAETVRGDIVVKGGSGFVTAKSIQGEVIVEDAKGRINVSTVNEGIRITGASGEVSADSTNGDILLSKVDAKSLEVTTVNGDVRYEGTIGSSWSVPLLDPQRRHHDDPARNDERDVYRAGLQRRLQQQPADQDRRRRTSRTARDLHARERRRGGGVGELRWHGAPAPAGHSPRPSRAGQGQARSVDETYSALSATTGSTCAARAAGLADAATAVSVSSAATVPNDHGSYGRT